MRIYLFVMLNFFKKKSPAPAPEPAPSTPAAEPAARDASPSAPPAPPLAPRADERAPASPPPADEQGRWPSATVEAPLDLGGASASSGVPDATAGTGSATAEPAAKKSWLQRLRQGLSRTGQSIGGLFVGVKVDENLFEELETALIMADAGVEATEALLTALRARVKKERIEDAGKVRDALRQILADHLRPLERRFELGRAKPLVVMIAGVNGAGKTTSIGKLANTFQRQGASVLLAAGDTFRAAARQQLMEWGARNNVSVIAQEGGDPAAVAFDAVNAGRARGAGVVMVDTAGRLPTQLHLMEELKKIRRVIGKADPAAPHEVLLVVDGNTGQNALAQIRAFDAAINLTGLVVTKLDGTAKGGTLAAVAAGSQGVRPVPVYWIGVGEGLEDLQPFVADEFASALLGMSN
ncbi:signal recognition particle-docking protein FtsY [Bordetella bronchialis]|uniref:signal recognition particle-docking protein FtsY n=1 Tax=Bordetella bronchialis TaxID=463025 RepID=UPI003CFCE989